MSIRAVTDLDSDEFAQSVRMYIDFNDIAKKNEQLISALVLGHYWSDKRQQHVAVSGSYTNAFDIVVKSANPLFQCVLQSTKSPQCDFRIASSFIMAKLKTTQAFDSTYQYNLSNSLHQISSDHLEEGTMMVIKLFAHSLPIHLVLVHQNAGS